MAELPILPLKTDALLADTTHMSTEEFGAYMKILIVMWRQKARLPDDEKELALIAGVSLFRWRRMAEKVRRPLTSEGGLISQKNLTATWLDVKALRAKRATAANSRWDKEKGHANAYAKRGAKRMQKPMQTPMQNDANQNQISKKEKHPPVNNVDKSVQATRSLASALPSGALANGSTKPPPWKTKRPSEMNAVDWAAYYAAKRAGQI